MLRRSAATLAVLMLTACTAAPGQPDPSPPTTSDGLIAATYQVPPMPISPTWQPEDPQWYLFIDSRWKEFLDQPPDNEWRLIYPTDWLALEVGRDLAHHELLHPDQVSPPTPVTMLGTAAEMRTSWYGDDPQQYWVWYLTDFNGLSIVVSGTNPETVERFARGLRPQPREMPVPFEVGLLPEGYVPIVVNEHRMEFTSATQCCDGGYVVVFLVEIDIMEWPGVPTTVGDKQAEVVIRDNLPEIQVWQPDGSELRVSATSDADLDTPQLLRLTENITITPDAAPYGPHRPRR
jgi:hypothetical protein